jgi:hypothetical protein
MTIIGTQTFKNFHVKQHSVDVHTYTHTHTHKQDW